MANSNHSMPKRHNSESWITFTLILAAALLLAPCPATAEQLLDVRIGEYDGYTRVVFEVDTPSAQPRIDIGTQGQLWVDFDHTAVNLVRKIPVKRSRYIDNIQFWQHDGHLSIAVKLNYPRYRFKTFSLDTPPRIAVDIYPGAVPAGDSQAATAAAKSPEKPTPEMPLEKQIPRQISQQDRVDQTLSAERPALKQTESAQSRPAAPPLVEAKPQEPIARALDSDQETAPVPMRSPPQTVFRLQFFLVIGLVVITIGILFLLLMMLLARHRFSKVKSKLRASDFLQEQDKKIEAIDKRIKEQMERYEKA